MRTSLGVLIVATTLLFGGRVSAITGGELLAFCAGYPDAGRPVLCEGYIFSILDLLQTADPVVNRGRQTCIPDGVDRAALIPLIAEGMSRHPERHQQTALELVADSLGDRFACR